MSSHLWTEDGSMTLSVWSNDHWQAWRCDRCGQRMVLSASEDPRSALFATPVGTEDCHEHVVRKVLDS